MYGTYKNCIVLPETETLIMRQIHFNKKHICFLLTLAMCIVPLISQTLPRGYRSITLGMTLDEVKKALTSDSVFAYRGERDVSLLPDQEKVIIETEGSSFLSRCWFQFYNQRLYTITITMNEDMMDYYSVFKTLFDKYGQPKSLSPEIVVWENTAIRMSLERPLSVKYIDMDVYSKLLQSSQVDQSAGEFTRQKFLESF